MMLRLIESCVVGETRADGFGERVEFCAELNMLFFPLLLASYAGLECNNFCEMIDSMIIDKAEQSGMFCSVIVRETNSFQAFWREMLSPWHENVEIAIIAKHRSVLTNKIQHFATT
jgi:hypothetical protein